MQDLQTSEHSNLLLDQIMDTAAVGICVMDTKGTIVRHNDFMAELFHHSTLIGTPYVNFLAPELKRIGAYNIQRLFSREIELHQIDRRYIREDQTTFWGQLSAKALINKEGLVEGAVAVIVDIDARKQAENQLRQNGQVFAFAQEGILLSDAYGVIQDVNPSFSRITGYSHEEAVGQTVSLLKSGRHGHEFYQSMWNDLQTKGAWSGELWNKRKNGEIYPERRTISAVLSPSGSIQSYIALFSDISNEKQQEERLQHLAHYDQLTDLPNRYLLSDRLDQAIANADRYQEPMAVVYFDLDGFKKVNDTLGHDAGDQLLVSVSQKVKRMLREGDTLARIGGDEFVAILLRVGTNPQAHSDILSRLLAAVSYQYPCHAELQVSASIGLSFYPQKQLKLTSEDLLKQADIAMYQAKTTGKNRFVIFQKMTHNKQDA